MEVENYTIIGSPTSGYYFHEQYKGDTRIVILPESVGYGDYRFFSLTEAMLFIFWWRGLERTPFIQPKDVIDYWKSDIMTPEGAEEPVESGTDEAAELANQIFDEKFVIIDVNETDYNYENYPISDSNKWPVYLYRDENDFGQLVERTFNLHDKEGNKLVRLSFDQFIDDSEYVAESEGRARTIVDVYNELQELKEELASLKKTKSKSKTTKSKK